jgi:pimeloyl-ACP methyl ester carboxylesterase
MPRLVVRTTTYGFDDVGTGPLVVFGHGLSCDRALFADQVAALRTRVRCVALDWPGHGHETTFDPSGWSLDDLAADTAELIVRLGGGPAVLVGLSQGAMVFMRVALEHPELVRALVLADTTARVEPPERAAAITDNLLRLRSVSAAEREEMIRTAAIPAFFGEPWRRDHPELVDQEVRRRVGHDRVGYELAVRAVVDREPIPLERLVHLRIPTLVIVGELDTLTPPDHARELADTIPGACLAVVPRAAHHTPIEAPGAVTGAIESFLNQLQRPETS